MHRYHFTPLLFFFLAATATGQSRSTTAQIDSIAEAALREGPTAALSIAVVHQGETIAQRGYGFADIENEVRATDLTVYRLGSLTKQFTSAAIMRLVDQGRIGLQDDLTQYLPDYPTQGNAVTIEHLLTHTSGIKSYTGLGPKWRETIRLDLTREEMLDLFKNEPFDFAPGDRYLYNNSGYFLLGMIIAEVTGQSYANHVREQFFEPLDMPNSHYCTNREIVKYRAEGYARDSSGLVNDEYLSMDHPYAAGALCGNLIDVVTWTDALNAGQVVSPASYERMTTAMVLNDGDTTSYGYGLGIGKFEGHRVISHGGGINGFNTYLARYPDDELTVVVLANTEGANPGRITRDIARLILGIEVPKTVDLPLSADERTRYEGVYQLGAITLRVFSEGDELRMEVSGRPPTQVLYQGGHRFIVAEDTDIELVFSMAENAELASGVSVRQGGQEVASGERTQD